MFRLGKALTIFSRMTIFAGARQKQACKLMEFNTMYFSLVKSSVQCNRTSLIELLSLLVGDYTKGSVELKRKQ